MLPLRRNFWRLFGNIKTLNEPKPLVLVERENCMYIFDPTPEEIRILFDIDGVVDLYEKTHFILKDVYKKWLTDNNIHYIKVSPEDTRLFFMDENDYTAFKMFYL